jgi:hypothetical protein
VFWLWAVTAFSSVTAAVAGIGWTVTAYRLSNTRWKVVQLQGEKHAGRFHRCHEHDSVGIGASDERSIDLTEISRRWQRHHQDRID